MSEAKAEKGSRPRGRAPEGRGTPDDEFYGGDMRVLLTGAAGFIGRHVGAALRCAGHDVLGLDCWHPAAHPRPGPVGDIRFGDVRDPDAVHAALADVDAVVHHAAMVGMGSDLSDLPRYVDTNDLGTAVLLAGMAQRGVTRLVLASSMVVYGEGRTPATGTVRSTRPRARPTTSPAGSTSRAARGVRPCCVPA